MQAPSGGWHSLILGSLLAALHGLGKLRLLSLCGCLRPFLAALLDGRGDSQFGLDLGDFLEGRGQLTLYGIRPAGVITEQNVVDTVHALALGGHGEGACQVGAELVGGAALFGVQTLGAFEGLFEKSVPGMEWIINTLLM